MTELLAPTQLEQVQNELKKMNENLASVDILDYSNESGITRITIYTYLKGEGNNLDVGLKMMEFFHKRISDRAEKIASIIK